MAVSDCEKCYETPCTCGWGYRDWNAEQRLKLAAAALGIPVGVLRPFTEGVATEVQLLEDGVLFGESFYRMVNGRKVRVPPQDVQHDERGFYVVTPEGEALVTSTRQIPVDTAGRSPVGMFRG